MDTETKDGNTEAIAALQSLVKIPKRKCCSVEYEKGVLGNQGCSRGKHQHKSGKGAADHATGTDFWPDKSTTKAVFKRMKALGIKWEGMGNG